MGGWRSRQRIVGRLGRDVIVRAGALVVCMSCLAWAHGAGCAEPPVDPGLLEFLGSVDSEDGKWHEYLASTDVDQVAKRAARPPAAVPAPATPSGSSGGAARPVGAPPASPPVSSP